VPAAVIVGKQDYATPVEKPAQFAAELERLLK
jgi:hypothetical protein